MWRFTYSILTKCVWHTLVIFPELNVTITMPTKLFHKGDVQLPLRFLIRQANVKTGEYEL
jgi:hypothetical protein